MRTRRPLALSIATTLALAAPLLYAAPPTTVPTTTGSVDPATAFLAEQRRAIADDLEKADVIATRPIEKLIRLSIENGRLVARLLPPEVPDNASMKLPGEGAVVISRIHSRANPENEALNFEYLQLDAADAKHPRASFVQLLTNVNSVRLTLNEESPSSTTSADLFDNPIVIPGSDDPPIASLRFSRQLDEEYGAKPTEDAPAADDRGAYLTAANFPSLLDADHDAVVSAMSEALTSLRAMHVLSGLSDDQARQLMDSGTPVDADVARGVQAIVESLKADGADAVEASVAKLAKLGPTAVAALGAADRKGWSPDLKMSVDTVLAQVALVPASRASLLLATPARLIDLLYWPDPSIRAAAAQRLAPTLGKDALATFDANKDPYAQAMLIESARARLPRDAKSK